jgi:hypothetical protein
VTNPCVRLTFEEIQLRDLLITHFLGVLGLDVTMARAIFSLQWLSVFVFGAAGPAPTFIRLPARTSRAGPVAARSSR